MIPDKDLNIYKAISQQKAITEKYVGHTRFDWIYTEADYTAECTIAVPFDLFDKTIVGILQVDDVLSIQQIGDILGMNVIDNPKEQQYFDEAEYEILREALDHLKRYDMLETGDIHYSACRLTSIGREYAQKGRKFKVEANKPFTLFYDHISQEHNQTRPLFQKLKGERTGSLQKDFDYEYEPLMKHVASIQVPDIYNVETGNSFTDPKLDLKKSQTFSLELNVALIYDLQKGTINLIAYEPSTRTIVEYFTKWLNDNHKEQIINKFLEETDITKSSTPFPVEYVRSLSKDQDLFLSLLDVEPESALLTAKEANTKHGLIDVEYFWNNLSEFINDEIKEAWFFLPDATHEVLSILRDFIDDTIKARPYLFIAINKKEYEKSVQDQISQLLQMANNLRTKVFLVEADFKKIEGFRFWAVDSNIVELDETLYAVDIKGSSLSLSHLIRSIKEVNTSSYISFKNHFACSFLPIIEEQVTRCSFNEEQPPVITKDIIGSCSELDEKAQVFANLYDKEEVQQQLKAIGQVKVSIVQKLKEVHQIRLSEQLDTYIKEFELKKAYTSEEISSFSKRLEELENEYLPSYDSLIASSNELKTKIQQEEKRIFEEHHAKTYIIDTNIFIEDPHIISKIDNKHYVVLSQTVIQELDKLKQREALRDKAAKALSVLNKQLGKNKKLRTAKANTRLLDEDYQQQSADNRILSVAFKFIDKNPILLTNDNGLQLKAKSIDIPTVSLRKFLDTLDSPKGVTVVLDQIDYNKIMQDIRPNKNGLYPVGIFMKLLRERAPHFDLQELGFSSAYEFVSSLDQFDIIERKFMKMKVKPLK